MTERMPSTIVLVADHSMEMLNRIVSVLRARRYRIRSLMVEPSGTEHLASVRIVLDPSSDSVARAVSYLQRIEEVHEVHIADGARTGL